ncbi:helix-turn-helix domain-containing protein [Chitinilyticum litopenaei]|uniref:helix-turn-helix domain-containing protein n=1 Tax=Chitinilyticum litopenaei TaxID=1121276 RepID=UPI0003F91D5F|nr:helix-turn-helix domain-containing protein [Chitinilyticum litopenaei]
MNARNPPPLPAVEVFEFSDASQAGNGIELLEQDAMQLASTPLRVRRVIVRLGQSALVYHSANQRVRSNSSAGNGCLAYVVFGPEVRGTVNGREVGADMLLAVEPGAEARFVTEPGWQSITLLVAPRMMSEQLLARQSVGGLALPAGLQALQLAEGAAAGLFAWGKRLVDTAERQPERFNERVDVRMAVEAELFDTLIAALHHAHGAENTRESQTRQAYSQLIRKVETHALALVGHPLRVGDLCRVAAVSERTLENAFKAILGMTPLAYLTRIRLHRARQALQSASRGTTTVSAVALDWGFWHFGDFSRLYRACFGERPSDTLRRKPDEPQPMTAPD